MIIPIFLLRPMRSVSVTPLHRSPDGKYRTTPLRGLFARAKGGFFHDGRFPALLDVVNHYNDNGVGNDGKPLGLTAAEKGDLVEFLKSL